MVRHKAQANSGISLWAVLAAVLGAVYGVSSLAADLVAPFSIENANVLPTNVRNPRFVQLFMTVNSKFGANGQHEPLGKALNRDIMPADLLKAQKTDYERAELAGLLDAERIEGPVAKAAGIVTSEIDVKVPALAWGINDRLTVAFALPIYRFKVQAATATVRTADGEKLIQKIQEKDVGKANEAADTLNSVQNSKLRDNGYTPVGAKTVTGPGDLQMITKYQLWTDPVQSLALRPVITLPTGTTPNADNAIDVPTGDGRWKAGVGLIHDLKLRNHWRWSQQVAYTLLMPHQMDRRLPTSLDDSVSDDKETLTRRLGNTFLIGTGIDRLFPSIGLIVGAGYTYQFQSQQRFTGKSTDPLTSDRYRMLEEWNPSQSLHAVTMTAGFSTIEWYRSKDFFYPFEANFAYSIPVTGQNVPTSSVFTGEVVLFF